MGLFGYTVAGGGFALIGAWEVLLSSSEILKFASDSPLPQTESSTRKASSFSSSISFLSVSLVSFLFILNSLISLIDARESKDNTGFVLQLEILAIVLLFFVYSVLGLLTHASNSFRLPSSILNTLCLFAFAEEFLLFYLQRKDPDGVENRYFDLLLVPIVVCVFSTILELKSPKSIYARMARGVGLILQGTWFVQMGFSLFSDWMANGCSLHLKSRGNYTVTCKGHPEYHRGRAIATLQFNCHLALLVVLIVGAYSIVCRKNGIRRDFLMYKPLGAEMQPLESRAEFTLDSDDDGDESGIKDETDAATQKAHVVPEYGMNGQASSQ